MAGLNARAVPIACDVRVRPAARGFAQHCAGRCRFARATHFDADRHFDGATQHFARAKSGRVAGAEESRTRSAVTASRSFSQRLAGRPQRASTRIAESSTRPNACRQRRAFACWPAPCIGIGRMNAAPATQPAHIYGITWQDTTQCLARLRIEERQISSIGQRRPLVIITGGRRFCLAPAEPYPPATERS